MPREREEDLLRFRGKFRRRDTEVEKIGYFCFIILATFCLSVLLLSICQCLSLVFKAVVKSELLLLDIDALSILATRCLLILDLNLIFSIRGVSLTRFPKVRGDEVDPDLGVLVQILHTRTVLLLERNRPVFSGLPALW